MKDLKDLCHADSKQDKHIHIENMPKVSGQCSKPKYLFYMQALKNAKEPVSYWKKLIKVLHVNIQISLYFEKHN